MASDNEACDIRVPELDRFVALLPELHYAVNRILEDSTPVFSKKVGVALWALGASTKSDTIGPYLSTSDLVRTFREWFVVSEASANPEVSKVKRDLFALQFIKIEGDRDHIHLTSQGEDALRQMQTRARSIVQEIVSVLNPNEQGVLWDLAQRMLAAGKPRKPRPWETPINEDVG